VNTLPSITTPLPTASFPKRKDQPLQAGAPILSAS
jgi:hypothetical protein